MDFAPITDVLSCSLLTLLLHSTDFWNPDSHLNGPLKLVFAFLQLKRAIVESPVLGYPRPEGKLILDADGSSHAVGAVLFQQQDAYYSQTFKYAERQYCVTGENSWLWSKDYTNSMSTYMDIVSLYAQTMQPSSGF